MIHYTAGRLLRVLSSDGPSEIFCGRCKSHAHYALVLALKSRDFMGGLATSY